MVRPPPRSTLSGSSAGSDVYTRQVYDSLDDIAALWGEDRRFDPKADSEAVDGLYKGWQDAVARVRSE